MEEEHVAMRALNSRMLSLRMSEMRKTWRLKKLVKAILFEGTEKIVEHAFIKS